MSPSPPVTPLPVTRVIELRADLVTVATATALPPGSRVSLAFPSPPADDHGGIVGKIAGVERQADRTYAIRVRLHSLSRDARAILEALIAPGGSTPSR
jgi:hypothetical protein